MTSNNEFGTKGLAGTREVRERSGVFIPFRVTREYREELAKTAKRLSNETKEKLRHIQNNYVRDLKKHKAEHSEDLIFNLDEHVSV